MGVCHVFLSGSVAVKKEKEIFSQSVFTRNWHAQRTKNKI